MQVGDLVRFFNTAYPTKKVGIITQVDPRYSEHFQASPRYKVRWSDHKLSYREWYAKLELRKI